MDFWERRAEEMREGMHDPESPAPHSPEFVPPPPPPMEQPPPLVQPLKISGDTLKVHFFLNEEGVEQWYPALIVEHRPRARIYPYVIHFDDGVEIVVGLPDPSVELLTSTATRCMCPRCLLSHPEGLLLFGC